VGWNLRVWLQKRDMHESDSSFVQTVRSQSTRMYRSPTCKERKDVKTGVTFSVHFCKLPAPPPMPARTSHFEPPPRRTARQVRGSAAVAPTRGSRNNPQPQPGVSPPIKGMRATESSRPKIERIRKRVLAISKTACGCLESLICDYPGLGTLDVVLPPTKPSSKL
jgi:hypothetical protein